MRCITHWSKRMGVTTRWGRHPLNDTHEGWESMGCTTRCRLTRMGLINELQKKTRWGQRGPAACGIPSAGARAGEEECGCRALQTLGWGPREPAAIAGAATGGVRAGLAFGGAAAGGLDWRPAAAALCMGGRRRMRRDSRRRLCAGPFFGAAGAPSFRASGPRRGGSEPSVAAAGLFVRGRITDAYERCCGPRMKRVCCPRLRQPSHLQCVPGWRGCGAAPMGGRRARGRGGAPRLGAACPAP
jgi:hypothetical protein